ncbi:hypothetical protein QW131_30040 [Roseibium salinum]|nr:hypothetical protein [Roseibium salinum]
MDGTKLASYFLTTQPYASGGIGTTYCPDLKPTHVMGTWRRYGQQALNRDLFLVYGHGDGGGGPTREMLENIRRMEKGHSGLSGGRSRPHAPLLRAAFGAHGTGGGPVSGLVGRALPGIPPRHVDVRCQEQAQQPAGGTGPAGTGSAGLPCHDALRPCLSSGAPS